MVFDTGDMVSHYCWIDTRSILAYLQTKSGHDTYQILDAETGTCNNTSGLPEFDGHPQYSPTSGMLLVDSYADRRRRQSLGVYAMVNQSEYRLQEMMRFYSPIRFANEDRVDLHPRWDRTGTQICIDASFKGVRSLVILR